MITQELFNGFAIGTLGGIAGGLILLIAEGKGSIKIVWKAIITFIVALLLIFFAAIGLNKLLP